MLAAPEPLEYGKGEGLVKSSVAAIAVFLAVGLIVHQPGESTIETGVIAALAAGHDMLTYRQCEYTVHTRRHCALRTTHTASTHIPRTPQVPPLSPVAGRSVLRGEVLA